MAKTTASKPKYLRIVETLTESIQSGTFRPGDRLPSDDELADRYGASKNTVVRALCDLRDAGMVERIQGAGTFVAESGQPGAMRCVFIGDGRFDFETRDSVFGRLEATVDRMLRVQQQAMLTLDRPLADRPVDHKRRAIENAIRDRVDGVFYLPLEAHPDAQALNREWLGQLTEAGIAVVLLDQDVENYPQRSPYDLVCLDHTTAGRHVGEHLKAAGARRVLVLGPRILPSTVRDRIRGMRKALEGHAELSLLEDGDNPENIQAAVRDFQPDAVVGKDDKLAAVAMRVLYQQNLRVPDQVMVCGFDDATIAVDLPVPLSSYGQPIDELAHAALYLMTSRLEKLDRIARQVVVSGRMIERASTRRPAAQNSADADA